MNAITIAQLLNIGLTPITNWLRIQRIRYELKKAHRDADYLIKQIKNDSAALAYAQRQQAILLSELNGIKN